jgi:hypothetical protein
MSPLVSSHNASYMPKLCYRLFLFTKLLMIFASFLDQHHVNKLIYLDQIVGRFEAFAHFVQTNLEHKQYVNNQHDYDLQHKYQLINFVRAIQM